MYILLSFGISFATNSEIPSCVANDVIKSVNNLRNFYKLEKQSSNHDILEGYKLESNY